MMVGVVCDYLPDHEISLLKLFLGLVTKSVVLMIRVLFIKIVILLNDVVRWQQDKSGKEAREDVEGSPVGVR